MEKGQARILFELDVGAGLPHSTTWNVLREQACSSIVRFCRTSTSSATSTLGPPPTPLQLRQSLDPEPSRFRDAGPVCPVIVLNRSSYATWAVKAGVVGGGC